MLEVPGMETQEPATYPASVPKECRTAAVHAKDRVLFQSPEVRRLRGICCEGATMTPAQPEPSEYERVKIFSLVKDEDGSISRVPICLCELCRVNHFLCPRYASHSSAAGEEEKVLGNLHIIDEILNRELPNICNTCANNRDDLNGYEIKYLSRLIEYDIKYNLFFTDRVLVDSDKIGIKVKLRKKLAELRQQGEGEQG